MTLRIEHHFGDLTVCPGAGADPVDIVMYAYHESGITCTAWERLSEGDIRQLIAVLEEAIQ